MRFSINYNKVDISIVLDVSYIKFISPADNALLKFIHWHIYHWNLGLFVSDPYEFAVAHVIVFGLLEFQLSISIPS